MVLPRIMSLTGRGRRAMTMTIYSSTMIMKRARYLMPPTDKGATISCTLCLLLASAWTT
jgi:hypothetical protein